MAIIQGNAHKSSVTGFYPKTINGSLRFNDDDSAYLSRTLTASGSNVTWTWSGWVKRCKLGTSQMLWSMADDGANANVRIKFETDDTLKLDQGQGGGAAYHLYSSAVYRDTSAWYHIVVVFDSTDAIASERIRIYVNGDRLTSFASFDYPTLNEVGNANYNDSGDLHALGRYALSAEQWFDGYLAEVFFIDGTAHDADAFGETKNGVWVPKNITATDFAMGTNGFYLTFEDDTEVEAVNAVLWEGNSSTQSVTGTGFSPDFVWIKNRDSTNSHGLYDTVRGATNFLSSDSTGAEATSATTLTSFDSDGFTLGSSNQVNGAYSYVAWCWKAGGSSNTYNVDDTGYASMTAAGLTDGTLPLTGLSVSTTYGFSICTFNSGASGTQTFAHGLGTTPSLCIFKERNSGGTGDHWVVWEGMTGNPATSYGYLNLNNGFGTDTSQWSNTAPTSTLFTFNSGYAWSTSQNMIAYCWAEKSGYSAFGTYSGNGSSTGPIIYTTDDGTAGGANGFKPAIIIHKKVSDSGGTPKSSDWWLQDNTRTVANGNENTLFANGNFAEWTDASGGGFAVDFLDNGFQLKDTNTVFNTSGDIYIYAAFADTREAAFWLDQSTNDNDWQPVNLDHNDTVADSPTNNFATWNPLNITSTAGSLSDGNLTSTGSSASLVLNSRSTMAFSSGQWYAEFTINDQSQTNYPQIGILTTRDAARSGIQAGYSSGLSDASASVAYFAGGNKSISASTSTYGASFAAGDVISIALDADNGAVYFAKNGEWADGAGNCDQTFANAVAALTWTGGDYEHVISVADYNGTSVTANFGQQPFKYDPPA